MSFGLWPPGPTLKGNALIQSPTTIETQSPPNWIVSVTHPATGQYVLNLRYPIGLDECPEVTLFDGGPGIIATITGGPSAWGVETKDAAGAAADVPGFSFNVSHR
jgi:hypothetical protein